MHIPLFPRGLWLLLLALWLGAAPLMTLAASNSPRRPASAATVYDRQAPVTERELLSFLRLLPEFRAWAHAEHEEAHPSLTNGQPDFFYSPKAEQWITNKGWAPRRFFCIMGRMAAALVIVEEGHDLKGTRPPDMPKVSEAEISLAQRHLGKMLQAGGAAAPSVAIDAPTLPQKPK